MTYSSRTKRDSVSFWAQRRGRAVAEITGGNSAPTITVSSIQTAAEMPSQVVKGVRIGKFKAENRTELLRA